VSRGHDTKDSSVSVGGVYDGFRASQGTHLV
jgi:hypothetical protein